MAFEKPSSSEEEYFARLEVEKRKKLVEKKMEQISAEEKARLKNEHWMRCPKCGMEMQSIDYRDVTVDKCFSCGGIYLDDGELEKIIKERKNLFHELTKIFKG